MARQQLEQLGIPVLHQRQGRARPDAPRPVGHAGTARPCSSVPTWPAWHCTQVEERREFPRFVHFKMYVHRGVFDFLSGSSLSVPKNQSSIGLCSQHLLSENVISMGAFFPPHKMWKTCAKPAQTHPWTCSGALAALGLCCPSSSTAPLQCLPKKCPNTPFPTGLYQRLQTEGNPSLSTR